MSDKLQRRGFLAGTLATGLSVSGCESIQSDGEDSEPAREYYELRTYTPAAADKAAVIDAYLRDALIPALGRQGIGPVGVFTSLDNPKDLSFTVLITYRSLEAFAGVNPALMHDAAYLEAAKPYFGRSSKEPAFTRLRSRLMKAFSGMPKIEVPKKGPRVFEMRIYESHHEEAAWRKVAMFNEGEIDIMRDVKLGPVFYGETLISDDVPNLTYMTHATDMEAHNRHWDAFRQHSEWDKMKVMPRYADTVSKIIKIFLKPTAYSQV